MEAASPNPPSRLQVTLVVGSYMLAALVMVFVNKVVLNSSPTLPYSFLFVQTIMSAGIVRILAIFVPKTFSIEGGVIEGIRSIWPLTTIGLAGLVFNALCLRSVDTTYFQIARGLLLPMTILVSCIATRKIPRQQMVLAAAIVTLGFMIGVSHPEANAFSSTGDEDVQTILIAPFRRISAFMSVGLVYGIISSLFAACHAVARKIMVTKLPIARVAFLGNMLSSILLIPMIGLNGEIPHLREVFVTGEHALGHSHEEWRVFLLGGAITGVFGTFLSFAGLLSIKVTSPVTHMFSSAARSVLQTALGVLIFGDVVTRNRLSSLAVIVIGTLYFTWIQNARARPTVTQAMATRHGRGTSYADKVHFESRQNPEKRTQLV